MTNSNQLSRRRLLTLAGAGIGIGTAGSGVASASRGRFVVGTASKGAAREARRRASSVKRVFDFGDIGHAVAGTFPEEALRGLSRRPDVRYVEPDGVVRAISGPADIDASSSEVPWGVDRVDAEKVADATTGSGSHVAVIDTGIDNDHPDLAENLGEGVAFTVGKDWRNDSSTDPSDWNDGNGHGTHAAGIAAAVSNGEGVVGVASGATLHAVKVLEDDGSGTYSDVAAGIEYVADNGWDVGSLSLGGTLSSTIEDACNYAANNGVLLVAAAGNEGADVAQTAPAAYDSVVAVSATADDDSVPEWSNYGDEIELAAPGVEITSTYSDGRYAVLSGTSMACPHVAGAAGLLMAAGHSNADARTRLRDTAEDAGRTGHDVRYGYGILDVEAAVGTTTDDGTTDDGSGDDGSADTSPPSAPANLSSPAHTDAAVELAWDAASDDTGVDHYDVYADGTRLGEVADTACTVTGLDAGTTYEFFVTATDAAGNESDPSETITVTTDAAGGTAPVVDTFAVASASPNNPHAEVEVEWGVSGGPDSVTVELYRGSISTGESPLARWSGATGSRSFTEKFGSPAEYTVRLVASNAAGESVATRRLTA
ncbi:S8 family serine peptidase [Halopelagius longus]|uniref:Serine protease n=1 Tax=Halopelagius longus TaxID=1236180 RepID=A0A1H1DVV1_9EURY|nr:S8 family serine peptidase [Halopelagius longus]RDI71472.1 serine protease [Halopelagius longus]SDQ80046.1 subtilisin [Halopelagius longus]